MIAAHQDGLVIEALSASKTLTTLTARLAGEPIHVEKLDLLKAKARMDFAKAVCKGRPGINEADVERQLVSLADERARHAAADGDGVEAAGPDRHELLGTMPGTIRTEARAMLEDPELIKRIVEDIAAVGVAGEATLALTVYLIGTSRLLDQPLAVIVQGQSSSGKSYVMERVAALFPPEAVIQATQITPQALFYMPPGSLAHRWVVAGERSRKQDDDTAEATRALREMLSAGRLSKMMPVKVNGSMRSELVTQDGPIAYSESTTLAQIFDEDANRCILVSTDERERQTATIIEALAARAAGVVGANVQVVQQRHYAMQRLLEPHKVVIPFAQRLADCFPRNRVEARRAFPHLLSLIRTVAILHQYQRQRDEHGNLIADAQDYHIARRLLDQPFAQQLGGALSEPAQRFLERLRPEVGRNEFTTRDVGRFDQSSKRSITNWLMELRDVGIAEVVEPQRGPKPAIWQLTDDVDERAANLGVLPETEALFPELADTHADKGQTMAV